MTEKGINQDLSFAGGRLSDALCGKLERPCKGREEDKKNNVNRSNIYIYIGFNRKYPTSEQR